MGPQSLIWIDLRKKKPICFLLAPGNRGPQPPTFPHHRAGAQGSRQGSPYLEKASPRLASSASWSSTFQSFIMWYKSPWNENIKETFINILSMVKSVNWAPARLFLLSIKMAETSDCPCISPAGPAPVRWEDNLAKFPSRRPCGLAPLVVCGVYQDGGLSALFLSL